MAETAIGECGRLLCDEALLWQVRDLWGGVMKAEELRHHVLAKIAQHDERRKRQWFEAHEPEIDAMLVELQKIQKWRQGLERLGDDPISQALRDVGLAYLDGKADAEQLYAAADRYTKAANSAAAKIRRNPQLPPGAQLLKIQRDNETTDDIPMAKRAERAKGLISAEKHNDYTKRTPATKLDNKGPFRQ
jgi:hypothetical protein